MGEALLGGLIAQEWAPVHELVVVELDADRRGQLVDVYPGVGVSESVVGEVDAMIAVKPQYVTEVAGELQQAGVTRVLSIAAGVTIDQIEAVAPSTIVVRCMPNTPALVGAGASAIAGGSQASETDLAWAEAILSSVGVVTRVQEPDLDAITGVSGSGPAYVFHLAEGLIAAGVRQGLSPDVADEMARQTLLGAARLLAESGEDPAVLRQNVTSPGGTTAAGLAVFARHDFLSIIDEVVSAAADRSRELGRG